MSAVIFVGPTLKPAERCGLADTSWLAPAQHGDVYRAVSLLGPRAIGIIDGYFRTVPAVLHKEILWAIGQGVHVFGAASMGALRAAELAPFGMRGVGAIYQGFVSGVLAGCDDRAFEDDDEVAVIHGPAESGYLAASEAMVNIRMTLLAAERAAIIAAATRAALVAIAKDMYFPDRSYDRILDRAREQRLFDPELDALNAWLAAGRVDQKRADALAMIASMNRFLADAVEPAQASFAFEHTTLWQIAIDQLQATTPHSHDDESVLDELRLRGTEHLDAIRSARAALGVPHAGEPAQRAGDHANAAEHLDRLSRAELAQAQQDAIPRAIIEWRLLAELHASGDYAQRLSRAVDKRRRLARVAELPSIGAFSDHQLLELEDWFFTECLHADMPDDLARYAGELGYHDVTRFHETIFAEYVYRKLLAGEALPAQRSGGGRS